MSEAVAIVGSRGYQNMLRVREYIDTLPVGTVVLSGGAKGVDREAVTWAQTRGLAYSVIRPNYEAHGRYLAPKIRNREIAVACDRMVAFWDGESGGTAHVVCCAVSLGKPVEVVLGGGA